MQSQKYSLLVLCLGLLFLQPVITWTYESDYKFIGLLPSIPPFCPCTNINEQVFPDEFGISLDYQNAYEVFEEAGYRHGVDYIFVCFDNYPDDFYTTGKYINIVIMSFMVKYGNVSPVISKTSSGVINKVPSDPTKFFSGVDVLVIALILLTPFGLSIFSLLDEDYSFLYHVSNYIGLLFFQSEINFNVPINRYLINWFIQLVNLVFFSLYFWYLERMVDDLKTMGGLEPESHYYRQRLYIDSMAYDSYSQDYYIPIPIEHEAIWDLWDENYFVDLFLENDIYPFIGDRIQIYKMTLFLCDYHFVEELYEYIDLIFLYSTGFPPEIMRDFSPIIVDKQEYFDFGLSHDVYSWYPEVEVCPSRPRFDYFQLNLSDFYYLWIFFGIAVALSLVIKLYNRLADWLKLRKGRLVLGGARGNHDKEITRSVRNGVAIFSGLSMIIVMHLIIPLVMYDFRRLRKKVWKRLGKEKVIEKSQRIFKVVKELEADSNKLKEEELLTSKKYEYVAPKKISRPRKLVNKHLKPLKKHIQETGYKKLNEFYFEVIKDTLSRMLEATGVLTAPYRMRLPLTLKGKGHKLTSVFHSLFLFYFEVLPWEVDSETGIQWEELRDDS